MSALVNTVLLLSHPLIVMQTLTALQQQAWAGGGRVVRFLVYTTGLTRAESAVQTPMALQQPRLQVGVFCCSNATGLIRMSVCILQTLTALQQARLEVGAFPCLPDAMTVCGLLAAEQDALAGRSKRIAEEHVASAPAEEKKQKAGGSGENPVRARSL